MEEMAFESPFPLAELGDEKGTRMSWDLSDGSGGDHGLGLSGVKPVSLPPSVPVTGPGADPAVGSDCQGPVGSLGEGGGGGRRRGTHPAPYKPARRRREVSLEGKEAGKGGGRDPSGPGGGRGAGCCRPARFLPLPGKRPAQPSPEILIQHKHRTGFSTGSAKGDRDRKKPRGQEGSGPAGEGGAPAGGPLPSPEPVSPSSAGGLAGGGADTASYSHRFHFCRDQRAAQAPTVLLPAPHLSQVQLAQPGEIPGWTQLLPGCFLTPPQHSKAPEVTGGGAGSQQAWGGTRGTSEPASFHPPPQRAWPPWSHPSCACGGP